MVLALIKAKGKTGAKSAEVATAWKRQGRKGDVYRILRNLVKAKKVKRQGIKGQKKGSVYRVA